MTAQERLEQAGWIPYSIKDICDVPASLPFVARARYGDAIPIGAEVVLIEQISKEQYLNACAEADWIPLNATAFYKAVAE
jgi:hypothetical protein